MTEQLSMALDILQARHADRLDYEDSLGEVVVTADELSKALELADAARNAPWITATGVDAAQNWIVASFGRTAEAVEQYVTTDRVHGSALKGTAESDAKFVAHMHPIRVIRFVKEIERLRMALWRCRQEASR
jgi:hypothetical protein